MNADIISFERGAYITGQQHTVFVEPNSIASENPPPDAHKVSWSSIAELPRTSEPAWNEITNSEQSVRLMVDRAWSNSLERRYNDLLSLHFSGRSKSEDIRELVLLRRERRGAVPIRSGIEMVEEMKRLEATKDLTSALEKYVKVVGQAR